MMRGDRDLLPKEIVRALANNIGLTRVQLIVDELRELQSDGRLPPLPVKRESVGKSNVALTATEMVRKKNLSPQLRQQIAAIADDFDSERIFKNTGDIREFLGIYGHGRSIVKNRQEGFRHILKVLQELPPGIIAQIRQKWLTKGPASMVSLSDAIKGVGAERRASN